MTATSFPKFGEETTATEVCQAFDEQIRNKRSTSPQNRTKERKSEIDIVLLVGVGPESLGESLAISIASHHPAQLILASRTKDKIEAVISKAKDANPEIDARSIIVDLSSQKSVRGAAKEVSSLTDRLDLVINNAAVNVQDRQITEDGIEMHFGTNYVGLFLLTNLILPLVRIAADKAWTQGSTRIVNVTSAGHRLSPIRFSDYNFEHTDIPSEERPPPGLPSSLINFDNPYSTFLAYAQSKTANILFTISLTEHLVSYGILSYSVHPGSIWTGLPRNLDEKTTKVIRSTGTKWKTQDQGAATIAVAAFDPNLNKSNGPYLAECQYAPAADHATDHDTAKRLWQLGEKLVGEEFDLAN